MREERKKDRTSALLLFKCASHFLPAQLYDPLFFFPSSISSFLFTFAFSLNSFLVPVLSVVIDDNHAVSLLILRTTPLNF